MGPHEQSLVVVTRGLGLVNTEHFRQAEISYLLVNTQPICLLEQGSRGSFVVRVSHNSQALVLENLYFPDVFFCNARAS